MKVQKIKLDETYNVIIITDKRNTPFKEQTHEYYLQKQGYGNLYFMFGVFEKIPVNYYHIMEYAEIAENENFWGEF